MRMPTSIWQYKTLLRGLKDCSETERRAHLRNLGRTDLYFLLRYLLNRPDIENEWLFQRCREVQRQPDGMLDLWAREHYKSTIITFGLTIQDILSGHGEDPLEKWGGREPTIGIFSFNRPGAKSFLKQIKTELEDNDFLKGLYPDVLYAEPDRESPLWSLDEGLIVRRKSNPKEASVSAWGLIDSMPTGKHFYIRVYDDVITEAHVRSPDMIAKATEQWELSLSLGTRDGTSRYVGTRYHFNDPYRVIMARNVATPRIHKVVDEQGVPVFFTIEQMDERKKGHGPYVWACQYMQDPKADEKSGFKREWLRHYGTCDGTGMNKYIIVDPAGEKKKGSDNTAIGVIALGDDRNYYLLDLVYDRLNLKERTDALILLHRKWRPLNVGYEKYGKDSDIEHILDMQDRINYRFQVVPLGGSLKKEDRIRRLVPLFSEGRVYFPQELHKANTDGKVEDLIERMIIEEYDPFPVGPHDDFLDMFSRILDPDLFATFPEWDPNKNEDRYTRDARKQTRVYRSWKTA